MSKLTDYGIVLLTHMAQDGAPPVRTAQELAQLSRVPLPTASKILKELHRAGILDSHRGRRGGYGLARSAEQISVAAIVEALEGPVAVTECSEAVGTCALEPVCVAKGHWGPISRAIQGTLERLPLSALGPRPLTAFRAPSLVVLPEGVR
ncbi:MAG TPA: SUF system Fe-S cluster assembly regulator [Anaeromyxobacteraceae bacterium]|jgi:FeS assembly SUF system regulator